MTVELDTHDAMEVLPEEQEEGDEGEVCVCHYVSKKCIGYNTYSHSHFLFLLSQSPLETPL